MEEINLPVYKDASDIENEPPAKKKRVSNVWQETETFPDKNSASEFINAEKNWCIRKSNVTVHAGLQTFYYCNKIKSSAEECPAKIYLLASVSDGQFHLFRNNKEHIHRAEDLAAKRTARLDIMDRVKDCLARDCKPRAISNEIRRNEEVVVKPTNNQVIGILYMLHMICGSLCIHSSCAMWKSLRTLFRFYCVHHANIVHSFLRFATSSHSLVRNSRKHPKSAYISFVHSSNCIPLFQMTIIRSFALHTIFRLNLVFQMQINTTKRNIHSSVFFQQNAYSETA